MKDFACFVALGLSGILMSACGPDSRGTSKITPTAPTMQSDPASITKLAGGGAAPNWILHPVGFPMSPMVVNFPPRNEPNLFFQDLLGVYRDSLHRTQTAPTYVDAEGENVWLTEYFRFYLNGCSHADAMSRTLAEITTGASVSTCGIENLTFPSRDLPFQFQSLLESTYQNTLHRTQLLSYVDSEGANVWLAQYLRLRVSGGCDHSTAENKVFIEIRGGGVQPNCTTTPTPRPAPTPAPTPSPSPTPSPGAGTYNWVGSGQLEFCSAGLCLDFAGTASNRGTGCATNVWFHVEFYTQEFGPFLPDILVFPADSPMNSTIITPGQTFSFRTGAVFNTSNRHITNSLITTHYTPIACR